MIYEKVQDSVSQKPYFAVSNFWRINADIISGNWLIVIATWHYSTIIIMKQTNILRFIENLDSRDSYEATSVSSTELLLEFSDTGILFALSNEEITLTVY